MAFDAASGVADRCSIRATGGVEGAATPVCHRWGGDRGARGMIVFQMPALLAVSSFFYGASFGLLKIVWIVIAAVFLYDVSVETGQFEIMKQSVAAITPDRRLQLLLVAFCFGAFIEGCAGFGARWPSPAHS